MLTLQITGLEAVKDQLQGFSDRRFRAAVATALSRTAKALNSEWRKQLQSEIDRPERLTVNAPISTFAKADNLTATVSLRDQMRQAGAISPAEYIGTQERGGGRRQRVFERALVSAGVMPAGYFAVPGDGAQLDGFGNVRRQQIVQVLNQLAGGVVKEGYRRVISANAAKRARAATRSRKYFAISEKGAGLPPGVYAKGTGRQVQAVFFFVRSVTYGKTTSLVERARQFVATQAGIEMKRAIDEHIEKLARKGIK